MRTLARNKPTNNPQVFGPYRALMLKVLVAKLTNLPPTWITWLTLCPEGKRYLEGEGIAQEDLRIAIDDGVRRELITADLFGGYPAIALSRKVVQR